jgi:hypothetical protein
LSVVSSQLSVLRGRGGGLRWLAWRFGVLDMGKIYESIDEKLKDWLLAQKIFFVATAPLSQEGHVNCSPKDGDSFHVIDARTVVYLDLTGSGVETIAHVKENERIILMFTTASRSISSKV